MPKIIGYDNLCTIAAMKSISVVVKSIQRIDCPHNIRIDEVHLAFASETNRHDSYHVGSVTLNPETGRFVILHEKDHKFLEIIDLDSYKQFSRNP